MARTKPYGRRRRMKARIVFQRRDGTANEFNEPKPDSWRDLFPTRASFYPAPMPGSERYANAQTAAEAPAIFEVRSEGRTRGVLPSDRIVHNDTGLIYNIVSIDQVETDTDIRFGVVADR